MGADSPIIGDDPRAPVEVDEMLMCESCLAIVDHVMTDLKKKVAAPRIECSLCFMPPGSWPLAHSDGCPAAVSSLSRCRDLPAFCPRAR